MNKGKKLHIRDAGRSLWNPCLLATSQLGAEGGWFAFGVLTQSLEDPLLEGCSDLPLDHHALFQRRHEVQVGVDDQTVGSMGRLNVMCGSLAVFQDHLFTVTGFDRSRSRGEFAFERR